MKHKGLISIISWVLLFIILYVSIVEKNAEIIEEWNYALNWYWKVCSSLWGWTVGNTFIIIALIIISILLSIALYNYLPDDDLEWLVANDYEDKVKIIEYAIKHKCKIELMYKLDDMKDFDKGIGMPIDIVGDKLVIYCEIRKENTSFDIEKIRNLKVACEAGEKEEEK